MVKDDILRVWIIVYWIDNKSFGLLGELASILFEDFELSIGLSRDPRKNWGAGHYFLGVHSLLLIFCYQTHSLIVEEIKILEGPKGQCSSAPGGSEKYL